MDGRIAILCFSVYLIFFHSFHITSFVMDCICVFFLSHCVLDTHRVGNHLMSGGAMNVSQVLGRYPSNFKEGDAEGLALSRGRMIPKFLWDAMWKGTSEWFGIPANGTAMDKIVPIPKGSGSKENMGQKFKKD